MSLDKADVVRVGDSDPETADDGISKPKPSPEVVVPTSDLGKMVAECLQDTEPVEELPEDENDPDLLNELLEITGDAVPEQKRPASEPAKDEDAAIRPAPAGPILPTTTLNMVDTINTRIEMYKTAEKNANDAGDSGKVRRVDRGLKTLKSLLQQAKAGEAINEGDIPPEVSAKPAHPQPSDGSPVASTPEPIPTGGTPTLPNAK